MIPCFHFPSSFYRCFCNTGSKEPWRRLGCPYHSKVRGDLSPVVPLKNEDELKEMEAELKEAERREERYKSFLTNMDVALECAAHNTDETDTQEMLTAMIGMLDHFWSEVVGDED